MFLKIIIFTVVVIILNQALCFTAYKIDFERIKRSPTSAAKIRARNRNSIWREIQPFKKYLRNVRFDSFEKIMHDNYESDNSVIEVPYAELRRRKRNTFEDPNQEPVSPVITEENKAKKNSKSRIVLHLLKDITEDSSAASENEEINMKNEDEIVEPAKQARNLPDIPDDKVSTVENLSTESSENVSGIAEVRNSQADSGNEESNIVIPDGNVGNSQNLSCSNENKREKNSDCENAAKVEEYHKRLHDSFYKNENPIETVELNPDISGVEGLVKQKRTKPDIEVIPYPYKHKALIDNSNSDETNGKEFEDDMMFESESEFGNEEWYETEAEDDEIEFESEESYETESVDEVFEIENETWFESESVDEEFEIENGQWVETESQEITDASSAVVEEKNEEITDASSAVVEEKNEELTDASSAVVEEKNEEITEETLTRNVLDDTKETPENLDTIKDSKLRGDATINEHGKTSGNELADDSLSSTDDINITNGDRNMKNEVQEEIVSEVNYVIKDGASSEETRSEDPIEETPSDSKIKNTESTNEPNFSDDDAVEMIDDSAVANNQDGNVPNTVNKISKSSNAIVPVKKSRTIQITQNKFIKALLENLPYLKPLLTQVLPLYLSYNFENNWLEMFKLVLAFVKDNFKTIYDTSKLFFDIDDFALSSLRQIFKYFLAFVMYIVDWFMHYLAGILGEILVKFGFDVDCLLDFYKLLSYVILYELDIVYNIVTTPLKDLLAIPFEVPWDILANFLSMSVKDIFLYPIQFMIRIYDFNCS